MTEVTPDLAAKVISANKRNAVNKVSAGGTLTSAEAADFEAAKLSPESASESRAKALLGKWAAARRLTKDEEKELARYYPGINPQGAKAPESSASEETKTAAPPPQSEAPTFALRTDAPLPAKLRGHYIHPLKHYAAVYGYDAKHGERTIKRFVSEGRNTLPHDLPPLDEPAKMPAWWRSHHGNREVPPGIRRAAASACMQQSPQPETPSDPPTTAIAAVSPAQVAALRGDSFPEQVAALREELSRSRNELQRINAERCPEKEPDTIAWAQGRASRLEIAQRNFKGTFDILRKAENDLLDWGAKNELLVSKSEVASEFTRIAGAIYTAIQRLTKKLRPQLQGIPEAAADNVWQTGVRECFESLQRSDFRIDETLLSS